MITHKLVTGPPRAVSAATRVHRNQRETMATALRLLKSGGVGGAVSMAATRRVVGGLGTATPLRALMAVAGPSVAVPRVPAVNPAVASSRTFAASSGGDRTDDFVSSPASGYIHADYNDEPKVPEIARVIKNNREWAAAMLADDPDFFSRHTESQAPNYLFVGCSDSRVPANEIMGLKAGEVFVHRNIGEMHRVCCSHRRVDFAERTAAPSGYAPC